METRIRPRKAHLLQLILWQGFSKAAFQGVGVSQVLYPRL